MPDSNIAKSDDGARRLTTYYVCALSAVAILSIVVLESVELLHGRVSLTEFLSRRPLATRWATYTAFVLGVILFGVHQKSQFIYFQF